MSLDKWIKPEKKKKDTEKKPELKKKETIKKKVQPKTLSNETSSIESSVKSSTKYPKYTLICPKCKFQKILRKKVLNERDKICRHCKNTMNIKKV